MSLHLFGHTANPLHKIKLMRTLIEQHATALALPRRTPCAAVIICFRAVPVGDKPVCAANLSELSAHYKLAHLFINAVCTLIEHHAENNVLVMCGALVHLANLLCIYARGLFNHNVDTLFHAHHRKRGVVIVRHGNERRVNKSAVEHLLGGIKQLYVFVKLMHRLKAFRVDIRNGNNLNLGAVTVLNIVEMPRAHIAEADYSEFNFIHNINLSCDICLYYSTPQALQ